MLIALVVLIALLVAAPAANAEVPPGPRLAAVELIEPGGFKDLGEEPVTSMVLATVDPSSGREKRLLRGRLGARGRVLPNPFEAPAWTADGSLVAFSGNAGGEGTKDRIYLIGADGSGLRAVPGTVNGSDPILSPDGHTLAFSRLLYRSHIPRDFFKNPYAGIRVYSSTTTWIVDLAGGKPRRLTRWKNDLHNSPTSFAPDGAALLLEREDGNPESPRAMRMTLADGTVRELLRRAREARYSPDGSRIAFAGYLHPDLVEAEENHDYLAEELYVARADGTQVKRLSRSKGVIESSPVWDPSGQRLAYVQFRGDTSFIPGLSNLFPAGNALMQVNADGSCREKIASRPSLAFYGLAWQPGPGREAGPISC